MTDPISALSLACSVFQTIDFASKFASTAWSIYQNGNNGAGEITEIRSLRSINIHLLEVLKDLRSPNSGSFGHASTVDHGIADLAKKLRNPGKGTARIA